MAVWPIQSEIWVDRYTDESALQIQVWRWENFGFRLAGGPDPGHTHFFKGT